GRGKSLCQRHRRIGYFLDNVWHSPSKQGRISFGLSQAPLTSASSITDSRMPVKFRHNPPLSTGAQVKSLAATQSRATNGPREESKGQGWVCLSGGRARCNMRVLVPWAGRKHNPIRLAMKSHAEENSMKKWAISFVTGILAGTMLLPAALASETKAPPPASQLIPAGSLLHVRLTCTLTSKTSKPWDPFTGIVTTPITVDGKEIIASGSSVEGHVDFVKQSGRVAGVAQMRVVLDDIITPDD